jgi:spore coat protein U-like protein
MEIAMALTRFPIGAVRRALIFGLAYGALSTGHTAHAATAAGTLPISAIVTTSAVITTLSSLSFSNPTSTSISAGPVNINGTLSINCSPGAPYTIDLNKGAGSGATLASRVMTSGSNLLHYSIYTTAGLTTVWGDATSGSQTVSSTGTGAVQSIPFYGSIFGGQNVPAGAYADTVIITISF